MNFIPYEQWKHENADLWEQVQQDKTECDVCQGDGVCWTCGAECTHCPNPDAHMRQLYNEFKDKQIKNWQAWNDCMRSIT